ncbi:MAG: DMT family protein [Phycisphaerae bacterium]|nr:DMT family protein [Phycisphaerae bacterium]
MLPLSPVASRIATPALLVLSNLFMTYAWYGHLRDMKTAGFSLQQLKVMQEIITMAVFAGFAAWYMRETLTLDFLWATLCLVGAAFFLFRGVRVPA